MLTLCVGSYVQFAWTIMCNNSFETIHVPNYQLFMQSSDIL